MTDKGRDGVRDEGRHITEHKVFETAPVEKAREADDAPDGVALEAARLASAGQALAEHHANKAKIDKHLDSGLEETFPASDPVSISPGAD